MYIENDVFRPCKILYNTWCSMHKHAPKTYVCIALIDSIQKVRMHLHIMQFIRASSLFGLCRNRNETKAEREKKLTKNKNNLKERGKYSDKLTGSRMDSKTK